MSFQPYELVRWDHSDNPTPELLTRILEREGYALQTEALSTQGKTPEIKHTQAIALTLASGMVQVSFPGYGVIDLTPGDILEIQPGTTYDMTIRSEVVILKGLK